MDKEYENLINAIVLQAFKDLRWAYRKLKKDPDNLEAQRMVTEVTSFCKSGWCEFLVGFDGRWLLKAFWRNIDHELHRYTHEWQGPSDLAGQ